MTSKQNAWVGVTKQRTVYWSNDGPRCLWIRFKVTQSRQYCHKKEANKKKLQLIAMAFSGALTTTSVGKSVWMHSRSEEWRDCDVMRFSDTDVFHKFMIAIFSRCLHSDSSHLALAELWCMPHISDIKAGRNATWPFILQTLWKLSDAYRK